LPGIGEPEVARVGAGSPAAGHTLGALDLRGRTGATVFAIERDGRASTFPGVSEVLHPGDVVALAGSTSAIAAARAIVEQSRDAGWRRCVRERRGRRRGSLDSGTLATRISAVGARAARDTTDAGPRLDSGTLAPRTCRLGAPASAPPPPPAEPTATRR
jgi:hypothetical protein